MKASLGPLNALQKALASPRPVAQPDHSHPGGPLKSRANIDHDLESIPDENPSAEIIVADEKDEVRENKEIEGPFEPQIGTRISRTLVTLICEYVHSTQFLDNS
jgi:hypothetical protein